MGQLEINNLTKVFGERDEEVVAVNEIDIDIEDGEFLVLVGPSGCGKSTTLRCIAGLETVTTGELVIDGRKITDQRPTDRDIAMVFQNYALYPHMTAYENMAFGLQMATDLSDDEIERRVNETAAMMGIEALLDKRPGELSGGQQQRVALGRAIVREPSVFLMDEPLSNLDAKLRTTMRTELQELQQRLDTTTIYVTHDQTEAMTMGDRIAVLNEGELQQIGTPLECYHEPSNQFVASFIGSPSMNFFEGKRQGSTFEHAAFEYQFSTGTAAQLDETDTDQLTLGIRPEDIRPATEDDTATATVTVNVVEPLGESTLVYFDLGGQECTASVSGNLSTRPGEQISIVFPEDRIHLFDSVTGSAVKNQQYSAREATWGNESVGDRGYS